MCFLCLSYRYLLFSEKSLNFNFVNVNGVI